MALCRRADRQGPVARGHGAVLLVHGPDAYAPGFPLGYLAEFAHYLWQPGREFRTDRHQGGRGVADAGHALAHRHRTDDYGHVALLPGRDRSEGQPVVLPTARLGETQESGTRDSRGCVLRRSARLEHLRPEEEYGHWYALRYHDLPSDWQLRRPGHHSRRLRHDADDGREETPGADTL